jgi:hypothetical protein
MMSGVRDREVVRSAAAPIHIDEMLEARVTSTAARNAANCLHLEVAHGSRRRPLNQIATCAYV